MTFGQISVTSSGGPPNPFITQLNQTRSITLQVTAVDQAAKNVTSTQTYNYKNGTIQAQTLKGNVQTGNGNLSIWIIAGGLTAGDGLTQGGVSVLGGITETVARSYAGAVRPVNALVASNFFYNISAVWDQSTGFLLEITETVSTFYPTQNFTIHLKVTATNAWTSSSLPDFSLDATPQSSSVIHLGQSAPFKLNLTSVNGFYGTVGLTSQLLNSSLTNPPTLSLAQSSIQIPYGGSATGTVTLSTTASTPLGLYLFTVTGSSGSLSHAATIAVYVIPPDYKIFATPSNLTIATGAVKTDTITVEALGVFSGTVSLTSSSSSQLIQTSLDHSSVTLSSTVPMVNSTLTVTVTSFALPSSNTVGVTGTSGNLQHSARIPIAVTGPDFLIYSNTTLLNLSPGQTATAIIGLKSLGGFTGTVALSASLYGGLAVSLSPTSVGLSSGTGQSTLTVSVPSNTLQGDYFTTITGVNGILSHQTEIQVTVNRPYFSTNPYPYQLSIPAGTNATSTITLTSFNGFQGTVKLAAYISPFYAQLGYSLNPTSVTLTAGGSATSTLRISIPAAPTTSFSFINIYGISGNLSTASSIFVTITPSGSSTPPPPSPFYQISSNPFQLTITRGSNANSTISMVSYYNFVGQLSLSVSVSGGPLGTCPGSNCPTASLNPTSVALSANGTATSLLTITPAAMTPGANYEALVSSSNGTTTQFAYVIFQVIVPDFSLFFNAPYLSLPEGGTSVTPSVVISSVQGFAGTITLTRTIQGPTGVCPGPNCPTATLGTSNLALPANGLVGTQLAITTTAATPPGSYSVQVNATSGTDYHLDSLFFTVGFKDFGMTETPDTLILAPGGSSNISVSLGSQNGFIGNVTVTTTFNSPITVSPAAKNVTLTAGSSTTIVFTVSASITAAPGTYNVNVQATNRTQTRFASVTVIVTAPDFEMYSTPSQIILPTGGNTNLMVTLVSLNGLHGPVSLTTPVVSGTGCPGPTCPTATLLRSNVPLPAGGWGYTNITVTVPSTAVLGYYGISLTANNGTLTHTINISLDVVSITSTTVACSTPVLAGTATSCTVTANNASTNPAAPTGTVALTTSGRGTFSGPCVLSTATPTSATCSVNYTPISAGSQRITANYPGDSTHGSSYGTSSLTVNIRSSSTSITCAGPVLAGQAATCTATVTDTSGSGTLTPTGRVTLSETGLAGSFSSPTCTLSGTGASSSCSVSFTPSAAGTANVNAAFAGDQAHTGSSGSSPATINANPRTTAITISCNSPVAVGQQSTCTASVSDTSSVGTAITPTGTVNFSSTGPGSLSTTSCTLSTGSCTVTFTGSAVGTATVNGTYTGDSAHTRSSSTASTITLTPALPDFSLNTNPSGLTITQGSSATTNVTVTAQNGFTGTVTLSASAPTGITVSLSPSRISSGQSSTMTVTVGSTFTAGSYAVTVTGTNGTLTHQKTVSVTVNARNQSTQSILGLPTNTFYALVGAVAAVASVGALIGLKRKRTKSPANPPGP